MVDSYAVFGNPIEHSLSPLIHAAFARQTGREISYQRQRVEPGGFAAAARDFFDSGGKGLNITLPFKVDAFHFATALTERAKRAGAVNTLALRAGDTILGDNTDGAGLVRDIVVNQGWPMADKKVLLLGAGGAVRGVLAPILEQRPALVVVANRTESKATELANAFADLGPVVATGLENFSSQSCDLVINGTSASLTGELPPLPDSALSASSYCYDMMYSAAPTVFLRWAASQGVANLADGVGMLVEQAAEAFALWHGVEPETAEVIKMIRGQLG